MGLNKKNGKIGRKMQMGEISISSSADFLSLRPYKNRNGL